MHYTKLATATSIALACMAASIQAQAAPSTCTTTVNSSMTVNGSSLWGEVPNNNARGNTPCEVDQFSWNNFLYLVSSDGSGKPRFMSFAPWYEALPASGKPVWKGVYTPLRTTQLTNKSNQEQAGDNFELVDVSNNTVAYDMRVNKPYFDYIFSNNLYTKAGVNAKVKAYQANNKIGGGGIWLPPNGGNQQNGAIEIKTAWRYFSQSNPCPSDVMHCEKVGNDWWGLIGFHLVQKTPLHGEMIWATFEHVANAPDCSTNGSNPIQRFPVSPVNNQQTVNVNANIQALAKSTGWNLFDYDSYQKAGGKDGKCAYPTAGNSGKALCLTDPNPNGDRKTWRQVNVCRTDQLPQAGAGTTKVGQQVSDLNQSVVANFPSSIANKWKYYMLAGSEYVFWGSSGFGAPTTGCWSFIDKTQPIINCGGKAGEESVTVSRSGSANLANTTMETWMQKDVKLTRNNHTVAEAKDCFMCHQPPTTSYQGDLSHLFGRVTQSGSVNPQKQ